MLTSREVSVDSAGHRNGGRTWTHFPVVRYCTDVRKSQDSQMPGETGAKNFQVFHQRHESVKGQDGDGNIVGSDNGSSEVPNNAHIKQINTLRLFDSETVSSYALN